MPYSNKSKQLEYQRKWNKSYYQKNRKKERKRIAKRKTEIANWFNDYKSRQKCIICGEKDFYCLDLHHKDATNKNITFGNIKAWGWSKKRIENEIIKCCIVCANCHRKIHAGKLNCSEVV